MKVIIKSNKTILNCLNSTLLISGKKNRFKCNFLGNIKGVILLGNQIKKIYLKSISYVQEVAGPS